MGDEAGSPQPELPPPTVKRQSRWRVSAVWLVPLVAILVGIGLAVHTVRQRGPSITISFANADGLTPGKTEVRYKNVVVGRVTSVGFDEDFDQVMAHVQLQRSAARVARADSRFWVVRPRVDLGGVSGLGTLISGSYIEVDIGDSTTRQTNFTGLAEPPAVMHDQHGARYVLRAADVGSLSVGAPVYYRRFAVGRVTGTRLNDAGNGAHVDIFVRAPYNKLVHVGTRFWNASGVKVSVNAAGLKLDTQSLGTILAGGVAFGEAQVEGDQAAAPSGTAFKLYDNKSSALAPLDGPPRHIRMRFDQSVRGLSVGAEVDFRGIDFGQVTSIDMHYSPKDTEFYTDVDAVVYLDRLGSAEKTLASLGEVSGAGSERLLLMLVGKGMRAQLRTANLITGQLYVALDFFPHARPAKFDAHTQPILIPTIKGSLAQMQQQITEIVRKLNAIPLDRIGADVEVTLARTNALLQQLNGHVAPQATATLVQAQKALAAAQNGLLSPQSALQGHANRALQQVQAAAQALHQLADYLQRHPQALLRGRPADVTPPVPETQP
ncbi:MAG TPA: MlaD family protein [Nevskiaceae bacterium]|nr:MlaD family protein [Nevskiaceae bacterium]